MLHSTGPDSVLNAELGTRNVECSNASTACLHRADAIALHYPLPAVMLAWHTGSHPEQKDMPADHMLQAAVDIIILQFIFTAQEGDAHPLRAPHWGIASCPPACAELVATLPVIAADHHSQSRTRPQDEDSASAAADPCDHRPRGIAELSGR